jgi:hypothetical protein
MLDFFTILHRRVDDGILHVMKNHLLLYFFIFSLALNGTTSASESEVTYSKIHLTLNVSVKVDEARLPPGNGSTRFLAQSSGVVEMDFVFPETNASIRYPIAQHGYLYFTGYDYARAPIQVTLPPDQTDPGNDSHWVVAKTVYLGSGTNGDAPMFFLSIGELDHLNLPLSVTVKGSGTGASVTYSDDGAEQLLLGDLGSHSSQKKVFSIDIGTTKGAVTRQFFESQLDPFYTQKVELVATHLGVHSLDEIKASGEFDALFDGNP